MRLLLDTHIALWAVYQSGKLPSIARKLLLQANVEAFVSSASLWEIAIKNAAKPGSLPPVREARADFARAGFQELAVIGDVMPVFENLPVLHGDPFDRMLVAQAFAEPMRLLTHDGRLSAYDMSGAMIVRC